MNIVHLVSEVHPFSGHSSLAESAGDLPRKQSMQGHNVTVISPLYSFVDIAAHNIVSTGLKTWVDAGFTVYEYELFSSEHMGVKYIFFKNNDLFGRSGLYSAGAFDYADNDIRFGTFCQAAMNYIKYHDVLADILHCHDWQTALAPVYKKLYHNELKCKTVLTVHSVENMGVFNKFSIESLNLPWNIYNIDYLEYYDNLSFLKGGVVACDFWTTISPSFAQELISPSWRAGDEYDGVFFAPYAKKMQGILNGISYSRWNPETDEGIAANYSPDNLSGKSECKENFCRELGLDPKLPLLCYITKLIPARGVELILEGAKDLAQMDANLLILGHSGANYNNPLEQAKQHPNVRVVLGNYSDSSHKAYSAADIVLMPSFYEPCGISQFIGMRYGAIPVVRNTGGLRDGVQEALKHGLGFIFDDFSVAAMMEAIKKAIGLYRSPRREEAIKTLMGIDNSWLNASKQYIELYKKLLAEA